MIEMQAPLYAIKKQLLKRTMEGNFDKAISKYHMDHLIALEEKKPHS
jgi:sulfur transfer complex TusBCD TusB component (DsrH family)